MDVGRHGAPIGIASRNERMLRALERRFNEGRISASDTLWALPAETPPSVQPRRTDGSECVYLAHNGGADQTWSKDYVPRPKRKTPPTLLGIRDIVLLM
jgi:hypothetical protein